MSDLEYRFGLFAGACAVVSAYLFILDLVTTPAFFENARPELALAAPLALWLAARLVRRRTSPRT
jgi:hypothetical protein